MNRKTYILTLFLLFSFGSTFAHSDFWIIKDYGNVKVRIKTGFDYEEINKVYIIGQLAENFAKNLKYSKKIFLDFSHHYTHDCKTDFFISYDKGKIENTWSGASNAKNFLTNKAIVIRQVSRQFDAMTTLKLLEYAVSNIKKIKSSQKEINYDIKYCQWKINTIDTNEIKKILLNPNTDQLDNILTTKIERPDNKFKFGISYYFQNNKFTLYLRETNKPDTALLTIDNVYDFKIISNLSSIVFDTDSSFYFINKYNNPKVSKKQIINDTHENYRPFKIREIGGNKLSLYFWYYSKETILQPRERTLIYLTKKERLIQNIDKLLNEW